MQVINGGLPKLSKMPRGKRAFKPEFDTELYEKYRIDIVNSFKEDYESMVELTDNDTTDELLIEAKMLYEKVRTLPVSQCKEEITSHLWLMYEAVKGELDKYYGADSDMTILLRNLMIGCPPVLHVIKIMEDIRD